MPRVQSHTLALGSNLESIKCLFYCAQWFSSQFTETALFTLERFTDLKTFKDVPLVSHSGEHWEQAGFLLHLLLILSFESLRFPSLTMS